MAVLEKQMCNAKGQWVSETPEEMEKILAQLHENPNNAKEVMMECLKFNAPAWLFDTNVFHGIKRIDVNPIKLDAQCRVEKVDDFEVCLTEDEGGYSITVLSLPGCISQGVSVEEAIRNIKDAMVGHLAAASKYGIDVRR